MPCPGFHAERIVPAEGLAGGHAFVTDGRIAFDHRGYSLRGRLMAHHRHGWTARYPGLDAAVEVVHFRLLCTAELNRRKMLGPDQYLHDPVPRARRFIEARDHPAQFRRAAGCG